TGHYPLDLRRYLPDSWRASAARLESAGVPGEQRRPLTMPQIARELLDRVRAAGLPGWAVVAAAAYGVSPDFRDGRADRQLSSLVGVTGDFVVFTTPPRWLPPAARGRGRPAKRWRLAAASPRPVSLAELAKRTVRRRVTWRQGTKGKRAGRFAWRRVGPGQG